MFDGTPVLGNLFRFDLNDANPNSWDVTLLFKATFDEGGIDRIQPILTQPFVIDHPQREGFLVIFGTGSFITEEDGVDQEIQTVYGIWDNLSVSPQTAQPDTKANRLVSQTFENVGSTEAITDIIRLFSENPVEYETDFEASGFGTYGWYFDLNAPAAGDASGPPQFPGEKAIRRFFFRNGAILTTTVLPATNNTSCLGARPGALMIFDALTGGAFTAPLLDFNNDGVIDEQDLVNGQVASLVFNFGDFDGALVDPSILGTDFADSDFLYLSGGNETRVLDIAPRTRRKLGRQSWVELQE